LQISTKHDSTETPESDNIINWVVTNKEPKRKMILFFI